MTMSTLSRGCFNSLRATSREAHGVRVSLKRCAVTNSVKLHQVMSPDNANGMEDRIAFNQVLKLSNRETSLRRASAALDKAGLGEASARVLAGGCFWAFRCFRPAASLAILQVELYPVQN